MRIFCCTSLMCLLVSAPAWAQETFVMDEVVVRDAREEATQEVLPRGRIASGTTVNAAEAVNRVPGVSSVTRSANAAEPVIRGLGWERVTTQIEGLPLYCSCPARMDPPATYASPEILSSIRVVKALPSVTLGPNATGGQVVLSTDYDRGPEATNEVGATIEATYNEARDGFQSSASSQGGTETMDYRVGVSYVDLDNYETADGIEVPARLDEYGASAALGWRVADGHRLSAGYIYRLIDFSDFPSLPMNTDDSEANILNLGYRILNDGGSMERLELKLGLANIDHLMSNKEKPNRQMLEAETTSESESLSLSLSGDVLLGEQPVTLGVSYGAFRRDALRTRLIKATGKTFRDAIWPDAEQDMAGVFAETSHAPNDDLSIRLGARADVVQSDASPPGTAGYTRFYGPDAADLDREEWIGSGNVLAEWSASEPVLLYGGAGISSRAAGATERFYLFAPAPGGFQVGNPTLDPEIKLEATLGTRWQGERLYADAAVFAAQVNDYIAQTRIAREDVNGDGTVDNVRGFQNVDAELYGGELSLDLMVNDWLSVPATLAYVRGKNTDDDRDLPEIPPLDGSAALRVTSLSSTDWWVESGIQFAARQDEVDPTFPEDETPSWYALHLKGGVTLREAFEIEVGIENLLDEDYHKHLTREALMAVGDLTAGQEISEPGRYVYVTLKYML